MTDQLSGGWETAISQYLDYLRTMGASPNPLDARRWQLGHLGRTIGEPDSWHVSRGLLLTWVASQTWAIETRRNRRTAFRCFYRWAVEERHLDESPALALPRVRPAPPNPRPAPDAVYLPSLAAATPREQLILRLAAEQGMRRGEIAQVHSSDLIEDLIRWSLVVHGKGGRDRVVPLTRDLAAMLRALPPGYAFPGNDNGHLSARWVGKLANRLLPGVWTMHKLRHRAATNWWEISGHDVFSVQELLGHADPKTTRIYVKVRSEHLRAIVDKAA